MESSISPFIAVIANRNTASYHVYLSSANRAARAERNDLVDVPGFGEQYFRVDPIQLLLLPELTSLPTDTIPCWKLAILHITRNGTMPLVFRPKPPFVG